MTTGWDHTDHGAGAAAPRPRTPLGHGGVLGLILAIPLAALTLLGAGRVLGPHPPPRPVAATTTAATTQVDRDAEWCFHAPPAGAPARIPRGYRFLWDFGGDYGAHGQQTTWVYNRSCADPDANYPVLVIGITDESGAPTPTGPHGRPISLSVAHATATYYHGWMPSVLFTVLCSGGGAYFFPDQRASCRWQATTINLVLLTTSEKMYAILGATVNGIGEPELATVARRLSGAQARG